MALTLESLPVELITAIMEELDVESLVMVSYLSHRLHTIASDPSLNPWRVPIIRNLTSGTYEECMKHLSVRSTVPRQNWIEILSIARPAFLLFEATLPNLKEDVWKECFKRRFLPGWQKWKRDSSWREASLLLTCFLGSPSLQFNRNRALIRVWHRSQTTCTTDEAWTTYIVLNRNGSANELAVSSRNFNPLTVFHDMKLQCNLAHLQTHVRLVVQLADVRIIALGVLNRPRGTFTVNHNARLFLHPPGIEITEPVDDETRDDSPGRRLSISSHAGTIHSVSSDPASPSTQHERLTHPMPSPSHANYPLHTPSGEDKRWIGSGALEEGGQLWVGPLMLTAQITGPQTNTHWADGPQFQDLDLVLGSGRSQYSSFTWADLAAVAPWMDERITKKIDGPGLGNQ
ncbi:hypothetical protein HETIRDRAFT_311797 [Heterobasidion irregulare TC 32-1]|uniref:F-box domain-containing protein n=1 Tax=Heterobasidion irregulare (strain TC 32-1) TaxID=747525 RepID=W4KFP5_HETIT|nr:uncharacterized protein HETIRDRAFT_311797 [Heterobasidion irregulare TC 32-1]ETW84135.1 hypothetical protein HETIRDRAFT_311797 [Heterobasidion irregulare TC 32-1]